jgi:ubiquinone/menaquinone biosynthesis C-methylase UbiE
MSSLWQRALAEVYDPVAAASLRENAILPRMIEELDAIDPRRLLHLGCGRGWMTLELSRRFPSCEVIGVDIDPDVVRGATDHGRRTSESARFIEGAAESPPSDAPVDAIVSSLLFHHLSRRSKTEALAAAKDQLTPGGRLLIADFGRPQDVVMRGAFLGVRIAHGFDDTADNIEGRYPDLMRAAGFADACELGRWRSWLGSVALYSARAR